MPVDRCSRNKPWTRKCRFGIGTIQLLPFVWGSKMAKPDGRKDLIPMTKLVFRWCVLGSQAGFRISLFTVVPNVACSSGLNGSKDGGAGIRFPGGSSNLVNPCVYIYIYIPYIRYIYIYTLHIYIWISHSTVTMEGKLRASQSMAQLQVIVICQGHHDVHPIFDWQILPCLYVPGP